MGSSRSRSYTEFFAWIHVIGTKNKVLFSICTNNDFVIEAAG